MAPEVTIVPASPRTGDDLSAMVDEEGAAEGSTYAYAWTQDGTPRADLTSATVPASETAKGDVWEVIVTTVDGATAGAETTILNTAPAVTLTLTPEAPTTVDALNARATATDADGDPVTLTYAWAVDGELQPDATDTIPADRTAHGQRWSVTVTPSDDEEVGTPEIAEVTIGNTGPTAPVVALTPTDAREGDPLTCAVLTPATDVDDEPVEHTFTWDVDGVAYEGATDSALESVVDGADVVAGQTWTCRAVASDGLATAAATSAPVTIAPDTCVVSVELDGVRYGPYDLGETAIGTGRYPGFEFTSLGITSANGEVDALTVSDATGASAATDFSASSGWTWASGCIGGVSFTGDVARSTSDWAFLTWADATLDASDRLSAAFDANFAASTNAITFYLAPATGMGSSGSCGYGPETAFAVALDNQRYASTAGTPRLSVAARSATATVNVVTDPTVPVPAPGSGWHSVAIDLRGCP